MTERAEPSPIELAHLCAVIASDKRAEEVLILDMRPFTVVDYFVIATGRSRKAMQATADEICQNARQAGADRFGVEGYHEGEWVLVDYGQVIVHLFSEKARTHYDLEGLWHDAKRIVPRLAPLQP